MHLGKAALDRSSPACVAAQSIKSDKLTPMAAEKKAIDGKVEKYVKASTRLSDTFRAHMNAWKSRKVYRSSVLPPVRLENFKQRILAATTSCLSDNEYIQSSIKPLMNEFLQILRNIEDHSDYSVCTTLQSISTILQSVIREESERVLSVARKGDRSGIQYVLRFTEKFGSNLTTHDGIANFANYLYERANKQKFKNFPVQLKTLCDDLNSGLKDKESIKAQILNWFLLAVWRQAIIQRIGILDKFCGDAYQKEVNGELKLFNSNYLYQDAKNFYDCMVKNGPLDCIDEKLITNQNAVIASFQSRGISLARKHLSPLDIGNMINPPTSISYEPYRSQERYKALSEFVQITEDSLPPLKRSRTYYDLSSAR